MLRVPLSVYQTRRPQSTPSKLGPPSEDIQVPKVGLPQRVQNAQCVMPTCRGRVLWRAGVQTGAGYDESFDERLQHVDLSWPRHGIRFLTYSLVN